MLRQRIIPNLLLRNKRLFKTKNFERDHYIGDPMNTVRIFNECLADELIISNYRASLDNDKVDKKILTQISAECFMPVAYAGGIDSLSLAEDIIAIGFEKIVVNSHSYENYDLICDLKNSLGSQAVIGSIDYRRINGEATPYSHSGRVKQKVKFKDHIRKLQDAGIGELLLTSIDREGTWNGYDVKLDKEISLYTNVPTIINGGCQSFDEIKKISPNMKINAFGVGNCAVFQKKDCGVLINYPNQEI